MIAKLLSRIILALLLATRFSSMALWNLLNLAFGPMQVWKAIGILIEKPALGSAAESCGAGVALEMLRAHVRIIIDPDIKGDLRKLQGEELEKVRADLRAETCHGQMAEQELEAFRYVTDADLEAGIAKLTAEKSRRDALLERARAELRTETIEEIRYVPDEDLKFDIARLTAEKARRDAALQASVTAHAEAAKACVLDPPNH